MTIKQRQLLKKYADLLIKRWRLIAVSLLVGITLGLILYFQNPKVYQASALLSYEEQQINPTKMDPEQGRNRLRESLATLQELVTSRSSLEKVILQFSLYPEARKTLPIEDVIEMMRRQIGIQASKRGGTFSVSFQGQDPGTVMKVTNALASLFIEENLRYREERATETSRYTETELAAAKKVVDAKEQEMRDFKLKFFNEMPEQRESNLAQLQTLIQQNQGIQNSIQELERTKVMLQEQLGIQQRLLAARQQAAGTGAPVVETDADRLLRMRSHLAGLQARYTDKHPEIRRIQQQIAQLEQKMRARGESVGGGSGSKDASTLSATLAGQQVQAQLTQIDLNIRQLRQEQATIPPQIAKYQAWIEAAPVREAEWSSLTRDHGELRRYYDSLVAQNLQARSAENLERNQKGSKFKIVDPARLPEKPFKPNFMRILAVAVALSLGLSVVFLLAMDYIDTSFKDADEVEDVVGVPVICAIPLLEKPEENRKDRLLLHASVAGLFVYAMGLAGAVAWLVRSGKIIL
ncbi:MAG: GumC family protein [Desulfobulbus sp.]